MRKKRHFTSFQIISLGFLIVILTGSFLLMLPISTNGPGGASFWDSLFTATSAVCVTGLVLHDTAQYWSYFGQFVIITLIQIGGMGVVTVSIAIAMLSGRKIGLMQRSTMCEAISAHHVGGIVRMTGFILKTTMMIEVTGAAVMFPVFCRDFGVLKGLWYSLFHSISAFCNAGFDLLGVRQEFSSLTTYADNPVINLTIMALIVIGGIGFLTWDDIKTHKLHIKKYRMQSKVILTVTSLLILLPALYFYFVEFSADKWSDMSLSERILGSFFQSVTPRTAGFNTVDLTALSEAGVFIMIILMITGGSPGSTAGGIKTTTIAVLFSSALAVFKRKGETNCFHRRISENTVNHAATILLMYLVLFLSGGIAISCIEGIPILDCLFETASAIGTVGLTLGITTELSLISRFILIVLMFWGRVGGLTLVFAAISSRHLDVSKFPMEKITVG
ncbi:TrkH family potassium uptake protein [Blautia sp.]|uniref:TrkH family potassium uptake protein n=1 Tax=Blautia sp. TaxID=1955243 RepID=UPI00258C1A69|nr:potassium transporter TrkG [Blautia sp.]